MNRITQHVCRCLLSMAAVAILASTAFATSFTASDTAGRSAAASFSAAGGILTVTLTNTSQLDVTDPTFVLTALFFRGANGLTPLTAHLATGSIVNNGPNGNGNVGGEWAYESGFVGPHGATAGISSSGLSPSSFFGQPNFNGLNLQNPASLDGLQYGITSAGDNFSTGNGALATNALIKNSVVFTLGQVMAGFNTDSISNVSFQYGTSITDANIIPPVPTPEPGTMMLLGLGFFGLAIYGKRRKS